MVLPHHTPVVDKCGVKTGSQWRQRYIIIIINPPLPTSGSNLYLSNSGTLYFTFTCTHANIFRKMCVRAHSDISGLGGTLSPLQSSAYRHCTPVCVQLTGFGLSIMEGIDPNPDNLVTSGVVHTRNNQFGCLVRLEPNLQTEVRGGRQ